MKAKLLLLIQLENSLPLNTYFQGYIVVKKIIYRSKHQRSRFCNYVLEEMIRVSFSTPDIPCIVSARLILIRPLPLTSLQSGFIKSAWKLTTVAQWQVREKVGVRSGNMSEEPAVGQVAREPVVPLNSGPLAYSIRHRDRGGESVGGKPAPTSETTEPLPRP